MSSRAPSEREPTVCSSAMLGIMNDEATARAMMTAASWRERETATEGAQGAHSITRTASLTIDSGITTPRALAALRLTPVSYARRSLHGKVAWFGALENLVDESGRSAVDVKDVRSVGYKPATLHEEGPFVDSGQPLF